MGTKQLKKVSKTEDLHLPTSDKIIYRRMFSSDSTALPSHIRYNPDYPTLRKEKRGGMAVSSCSHKAQRARVIDTQTSDGGWVETDIKSLNNGIVPDQKIQKGSVTAERAVLALDCEMCKVEGNELALARISLVEWDGTILTDELIKPENPIIDYLTQYLGITLVKLRTTVPSYSQKRRGES